MALTSLVFDAAARTSSLFLLSIGLALVFSTRGIVNLAHGEFAMLGSYVAVKTTGKGVPFIAAIVLATIGVAVVGLIVERTIIRRLYDRVADCMLATWGVSLIAVQCVVIIFGSTPVGMSIPFGSFMIGETSKSVYSAVVICVAIAALFLLYVTMARTTFGLRARAISQDSTMAEAVGIDVQRVDMLTFALGAASAGFAGAVLAPLLGVSPTMGSNFIAGVFMTVIVGGANFVIGTPAAALLLGGSESVLSTEFAPIVGQVGLLAIALLIVRFLPQSLARGSVRK